MCDIKLMFIVDLLSNRDIGGEFEKVFPIHLGIAKL